MIPYPTITHTLNYFYLNLEVGITKRSIQRGRVDIKVKKEIRVRIGVN